MKIAPVALLCSLSVASAASAYEPTSHYTVRNMSGWKVYVNNGLLGDGEHAEIGARAVEKMERDLAVIKTWVADRPLKELLKVPIWLEVDTTNGPHGRTPTFHYHPGLDWLKKMDFHPGKHKCVEFSRAESYVRSKERGIWIMMHELAHAYHDRVLGFDNPEIIAAHRKAIAGGKYPPNDWVIRANYKEYFAGVCTRYFESAEARKLLKERDPDVFKILVRAWGEPKPGAGKVPEQTEEAEEPKKKPEEDGLKVTEVPESVRESLGLDPFYKKYVSARGFPVLGSEKVSDYALLEAAYLINHMLLDRPDVRDALIENKVRFVVMAPTELTTDVPEHSDLEPAKFWDKRARGLGPTRIRPAVSCGEENLLRYPGDPYHEESILIHEFAHAIHEMGLASVDKGFNERLKALYEKAMAKGLWKGKYAANNPSEYWAEGVQSFFDTNRLPDHDHNHVDTREELFEYDPELAELIAREFRNTKWRYVRPDDRKFGGHLSGYDPEKAPKFAWPAGLIKWYREYEAKRKGKSEEGGGKREEGEGNSDRKPG